MNASENRLAVTRSRGLMSITMMKTLSPYHCRSALTMANELWPPADPMISRRTAALLFRVSPDRRRADPGYVFRIFPGNVVFFGQRFHQAFDWFAPKIGNIGSRDVDARRPRLLQGSPGGSECTPRDRDPARGTR